MTDYMVFSSLPSGYFYIVSLPRHYSPFCLCSLKEEYLNILSLMIQGPASSSYNVS